MKRSNSLYLFFILLMTAVLTACSGGNSESGGDASGGNESTSNEEVAPEDLEGELSIWTFFGGVEDMAAAFEEEYPNVTVNVEVFPGDQYQTKLMTAIQSNTDVPDIFDLEANWMGRFINQEFVANLSEDMGADDLVADYVPYVKELGTGEDGNIRAISDHSSPGAFWYHRDLAEEHLGTQDPAEVAEMVGSWEDIIALGQKVQEESNGEVHLLSSFSDVYNVERSQQEKFVQDDQLNIDPAWEEVFNNMKEIRDTGVDAKLGYFSGGWGDALNEGNVIMFALPAWAGFMVDNENGEAEGKYGLAPTPSGYYDGGTFRAVYEGSENKDLANAFIEYISSAQWQERNLEETGNMPGLMSVYEDLGDSFTHEFFGDQKILQVYKEQVDDIPAQKATENEADIQSMWYDAASAGVENDQTYDQVLEEFRAAVQNAYPEIATE